MDSTRWITPTMKQTWVVLPALMNKFCWGMSLGLVSCLMVEIRNPESTLKMTVNSVSWFASLLGISMMIGFLMSSFLMPRYGRRTAYLIVSVPAILALFIIFTHDVTSLMIFRVFSGITSGAIGIMSLVIISEYTSPQNRGMFINLMTVSLNIGTLLVHVLGNYMNWKTLSIIILVPYIPCFLITYTAPESPSWLAERKEYEKSRQAFYWLRGRTEETTREIEELIRAQGHKKIDKTLMQNTVDFFLKFKKMNFLKPVFIVFLAALLLESSGRHIFPAYAADLVKDIMSNDFNQFYYTIVIDVLILLSGIVSSYLIRIMRLRTLLFVTGYFAFVVLMLACISLYLLLTGVITYTWIPVLLFASFFVLSNLGCSCVPFILIGEVFPLEHRVVGPTLGCYVLIFSMSILLKIMPQIVITLHIYGAFALMGVCMAVLLTILYFILPETTNRTLQEIEDYFNNGKHDVENRINGDESLKKLNE